jgi:hypothetical protein
MKTNLLKKQWRLCELNHNPEMIKHRKSALPVIGWREWIGLPDFGIKTIKVKVDTGARSSSLHAFNLHIFERDNAKWVRFQIHPVQRKRIKAVEAEAMILEFRSVRSSSGIVALRPVIITHVELLGITWPVELTLASRDEMGFRMLLGREAFRRRFLVDAGKSYYGGKPKRNKKSGKKATPAPLRLGRKQKE